MHTSHQNAKKGSTTVPFAALRIFTHADIVRLNTVNFLEKNKENYSLRKHFAYAQFLRQHLLGIKIGDGINLLPSKDSYGRQTKNRKKIVCKEYPSVVAFLVNKLKNKKFDFWR